MCETNNYHTWSTRSLRRMKTCSTLRGITPWWWNDTTFWEKSLYGLLSFLFNFHVHSGSKAIIIYERKYQGNACSFKWTLHAILIARANTNLLLVAFFHKDGLNCKLTRVKDNGVMVVFLQCLQVVVQLNVLWTIWMALLNPEYESQK